MKGAGLAMILGGKPAKAGPMGMADNEASEPSPDSEEAEGEGDETSYAKLVIDAMKDGDDAGAAKALVGLVRCCK